MASSRKRIKKCEIKIDMRIISLTKNTDDGNSINKRRVYSVIIAGAIIIEFFKYNDILCIVYEFQCTNCSLESENTG